MAERKLLDQVSDVCRLRHLSLRTEEAYRNWIKRYIFFHNKRHPRDLDAEAVRAFLTHLAVNEHVAASTQNQAFNARSEEHTSELQSPCNLVCRLLLEKKKNNLGSLSRWKGTRDARSPSPPRRDRRFLRDVPLRLRQRLGSRGLAHANTHHQMITIRAA